MTINMFDNSQPEPTPGMPRMKPEEFAAKWHNSGFGERQASPEMFLDICALVGHPTPGDYGDPQTFTLEKWVPGGFADAYLEGRFGWEFKGSDEQLAGAFNQLLRYQVYLKTPPLLIVSSFNTIRIRTNFPGLETVLHEIPVAELARAGNLEKLRDVFFAPERFRPDRSVEDVTRETASLFRDIVTEMEKHNEDPEKLARYLNQIVFCLYAEDAGLLPNGVFTQIVSQHFRNPETFNLAVTGLFNQMAKGGLFGAAEIAYFNGDLFNTVDTVELSGNALLLIGEASKKNWQNIEPSIFGTLFERALDASKRSQLGAHYTSADDIMLVVEPVVMEPLRREWEAVRQEVGNLVVEDNADAARVRLAEFQQRLFEVTVLDPACGSGNFLYLALRCLLDLEKQVIDFAAEHDWDNLTPTVKPDQMLGLEINHYAVQLARTALWIGYLQWHYSNGFPYQQNPILTPLVTIQQTDAILDLSDPENPREPEWPDAEFIIGNPPFLGNKLLRTHLGDDYVSAMYSIYSGHVPGGADLVCYWFEKARAMVALGKAKRAGLLATQGIRGGANRRVLERIKETGNIFLAWSDHPWILDGATVHISIVGFDDGSEVNLGLDGIVVSSINANLTVGIDVTKARRLTENLGLAFQGNIKAGAFDISNSRAQQMLNSSNPHNKSNTEVVRPWVNARDVTDRSRGMWIIDFGDMSLEQAALFEVPFEYINQHVRPIRETNRDERMRTYWWRLGRNRGELQAAIKPLTRFLVTPRVAKHRIFTWVLPGTSPDNAVVVIASDGDYTFGVLHSHVHEIWALSMGTQLREKESGFRYSHTDTFETFPFPQPTEKQQEAIAQAARELNELREGWLNSADMPEAELKKRTLTNLYNARPTWLQLAHEKLDAAVAGAYGWPADLADAEILERLLMLNLARAGQGASN